MITVHGVSLQGSLYGPTVPSGAHVLPYLLAYLADGLSSSRHVPKLFWKKPFLTCKRATFYLNYDILTYFHISIGVYDFILLEVFHLKVMNSSVSATYINLNSGFLCTFYKYKIIYLFFYCAASERTDQMCAIWVFIMHLSCPPCILTSFS